METATEDFIKTWGELSGRWGISRSVGQVHALLLINEEPLDAQSICEKLEIARSNVSGALKELQAWELIRVVHIKGERKSFYECTGDALDMGRKILAYRKKVEFDPMRDAVERLHKLYQEENDKDNQFAAKQLEDLAQCFALAETLYKFLEYLPEKSIRMLLGSGKRFFGSGGSDG